MRAILRNYLAVLRKNLPVTLLNLAGLTAAFIAFMLILMQVSFEFGYDRFRPAAERIYRLEVGGPLWGDDGRMGLTVSRFDGERIMRVSPYVEDAGMICTNHSSAYFVAGNNTKATPLYFWLSYCTSNLPATLQMELVEGDLLLNETSQILIPQSVARNLFGNESALGQRIEVVGDYVNLTDRRDFYVSGVYKDIPANSVIRNAMYVSEGDEGKGEDKKGYMDQIFYVRLTAATHKTDVEGIFRAIIVEDNDKSFIKRLRLQPLTKIYFSENVEFEKNGNYRVTMIFVSIALVILLIALINYFNFAVAISPMRVASVNMQKILGSHLSILRGGMLLESVLFCLLAYGLALFGLHLVENAHLMSYLQADMTMAGNIPILIWGGMIAVTVGFFAGVYPALYATSVPPALSLKGSFGLSLKGRRLRTVLIGFQYVISIGLIISAVFMNLQYRFLRNYDMGIQTDQVIGFPLSKTLIRASDGFKAALESNPDIQEIAFIREDLVSPGYTRIGIDQEDGEVIFLEARSVSENFIPMMGISVYEGRNFIPEDYTRNEGVILNRQAQEILGVEIGDRLNKRYEVLGFIENFNYKTLHHKVGPMFFLPGENTNRAYLKVNTDDYQSLFAFLDKTAKSLDPAYDLEPYFLDQHIESLYKTDSQNIALVTFFSVLAIIISLSGVFSLISFETRYKRREIGVRRVFGASVGEILALFNKTYIRVVAVCFVLAAPLAIYAVRQWLQTYTVKVPMHWWVFVLVLLAVGAVTAATVTWLSYRTATDNPVKALRAE